MAGQMPLQPGGREAQFVLGFPYQGLQGLFARYLGGLPGDQHESERQQQQQQPA